MTNTPHVRSGFTFIELMIVLTVLAILATLGGVAALNLVGRAKKTSTKSTLQSLKSAIVAYHSDTNKYPTKLRDLVERPKDANFGNKWQKGGYIEGGELPQDAWGEDFIYKRTPEGKNLYELYSYGPEGAGAPKDEWFSVWDR